MRSNKELVYKQEELEIWASKYTFESWITDIPLHNTKTNETYSKGDLIFCLLSYIDLDGKVININEKQYLQPINS